MPAAIREDATAVIDDVRRLVAREPGRQGYRLVLPPAPTWVELAARLALAQTAMSAFHRRYHGFSMLTGAGFWRTQAEREYLLQLRALQPEEEELSAEDEDEL